MIRNECTRRQLLAGLTASGAIALGACSSAGKASEQTSGPPRDAATGPAMTLYRDPSCPCCVKWAKIAEREGFAVRVIEDSDMPARKQALGVPEELASCHTAQVGGLVIEGHVPIAEIRRLLADNGGGFLGLAVPGMPRGSPGMEMPDGASDPFDVIAFDRDGKSTVFARVS